MVKIADILTKRHRLLQVTLSIAGGLRLQEKAKAKEEKVVAAVEAVLVPQMVPENGVRPHLGLARREQ